MTEKLSDKRIAELLQLNYLEAGGVDNWCNYDDSLAPWRKENAFDELMEQTVEDLQITFGENVDYTFPMGEREGGIQVWCTGGG